MEKSTTRPPLRPLPSPTNVLSAPLSRASSSYSLPRHVPDLSRRKSVFERITSISETSKSTSEGITTTRPSSSFRSTLERPSTGDSGPSQASPSFSPAIPSIAPPIWNPYPHYSHLPPGFVSVYPHPLYPFTLPLVSRPPTEQEWLARFQGGVTPALTGGGGGIVSRSLPARVEPAPTSYRPLPPLPIRAPEQQPRSRPAPATSKSRFARSTQKRVEVNSTSSKSLAQPTLSNPRPSLGVHRPTLHPPRLNSSSHIENGLRRSTRNDSTTQSKSSAPTPHISLGASLERQGLNEQGVGGVRGKPPVVVSTTLWEDELTIVLSIVVNGSLVARRVDNDWINCTKMLNISGISRGKRDTYLKNAEERIVFRKGTIALKGVWLPLPAALQLAKANDLVDQLYPLFEPNLVDWLFTPTNRERTIQLVQACKGRPILQDDYSFGVPRSDDSPSGSKRKRNDEEEQEKRSRQQRLVGFLEGLEFGLNLSPTSARATIPLPTSAQHYPINEMRQQEEKEEENGRRRIANTRSLSSTRVAPSALASVRTGYTPSSANPPARPSQLFEVPIDFSPPPQNLPRSISGDPTLHRLSTTIDNLSWFDNETPPTSSKTPIDSTNVLGSRSTFNSTRDKTQESLATASDSNLAPRASSDQPSYIDSTTSTRSPTPLDTRLASTSTSTVPSTTASTPFQFSRSSSTVSSVPSSTVASPRFSTIEAVALAFERDCPLPFLFVRRSATEEPESKKVKIDQSAEEVGGEEREEGRPGRGRRKLLRKRNHEVKERGSGSEVGGRDSR